jgi:hypothetical protein
LSTSRIKLMTSLGLSAAFLTAVLVMASPTRISAIAPGTEGPPGNLTGSPALRFTVDNTWPQVLPNNWDIGEVGGLQVDTYNNIWVLQRPGTETADDLYAAQSPPVGGCCMPAPPILEFNTAGVLLNAIGPINGAPCPAAGGACDTVPLPTYVTSTVCRTLDPKCGTATTTWFGSGGEHGIFPTDDGYVWLAANGGSDAQALELTVDSRYGPRAGTPVLVLGAETTTHVNTITGVSGSFPTCANNFSFAYPCHVSMFYIDQPSNGYPDNGSPEVYMSDGYSNNRVDVWDKKTGLFKRAWGAYAVTAVATGYSNAGCPTAYNAPCPNASPVVVPNSTCSTGTQVDCVNPASEQVNYPAGDFGGYPAPGATFPAWGAPNGTATAPPGATCTVPAYTNGTSSGYPFVSNALANPSNCFRNPVHCVTRDPRTGYIWVCDRVDDRLMVFTPGAGCLPANANMPGYTPISAACAAAYVPPRFVGQCYQRTYTLEAGGVWDLKFLPKNVYPNGAANEVVLSTDGTNQVVSEFTPTIGDFTAGTQVNNTLNCPSQGQWGQGGREPGYFHWVHVADVDQFGNYYEGDVDTGKRVQKFKPN